MPSNKGMKLTGPSISEPCSLSPVFGGRGWGRAKVTESERQPEQFLVSRMAARSVEEGNPLSADELAILGAGATVPDELADDEDRWERSEARLVELLKRCYRAETTIAARYPYHEAVAALGRDNYVSWLATSAGISAPQSTWEWLSRQVGLFVLLAVPGIVGLLIAGIGAWSALERIGSARQRAEMAVVAVMFGGFSALLFALWHRECRARPLRRRTRG